MFKINFKTLEVFLKWWDCGVTIGGGGGDQWVLWGRRKILVCIKIDF